MISTNKHSEEERMTERATKIILVHGAGHGAWCWYKVAAALKSQGYSTTAVDLAACGSDPRRMAEDVTTFEEYTQPLMDLVGSVPEGEKIVLVGHSFGGLSLAYAMDAFPEKIAVAVFVTAILPDTVHAPWHIYQQAFDHFPDIFSGIEPKSVAIPGRSAPFIIATSDPESLGTRLYQNCSLEDLTMATMMVRPSSLFKEDLSNRAAFSKERYGSVDKVFVICGEDAMLTPNYQRWMVENSPVKEVMEINGADHMAMLSKPQELCECIVNIVKNYAN